MMINDLETNEDMTSAELSRVSGGMKWVRNTQNDDVIDARGGQIEIMGITFTKDIHGNISGVSGVS